MSTTYDPALCERLCREARDERRWTHGFDFEHARDELVDARKALHAVADQLEAAGNEIERLTALCDLRGQTVADLAHEIGTVKGRRDIERPVVESAQRQRDRNDDDTDEVFAAVDAYRAARDKAGERG